MNLNDKLKVGTKVYCPSPTRSYGEVKQILEEGKPIFTKDHPLVGYYCFEVVFTDNIASWGKPYTGVFYLTAQQVVDNYKNNKDKEEVMWILDYTWQYTLLKYRKEIIIN